VGEMRITQTILVETSNKETTWETQVYMEGLEQIVMRWGVDLSEDNIKMDLNREGNRKLDLK
jgi:hypothetical protein